MGPYAAYLRMHLTLAEAVLFLIPVATFGALLYFLFRFLTRQGKR